MHARIPALFVVAAAGAVACTARDVKPPADSTSVKAAATALAPAVVTITATDNKFDAPASIPSGVTTLRIVDQGKSLHHAALVRLMDGKTMADLGKALAQPGPFPQWAVMVGGPNAPRPDGGSSEITMALTPGNYAILCLIPDPGGVPHFAKGMMAPLTVTPSPTPSAPAPVADVTVSLADYSFSPSTPLTAGKHIIQLVNDGPQTHEALLVKLVPGKSAQDLAAWVGQFMAPPGKTPLGPPPGEPMGGVSPMAQGDTAYYPVDLTPGDYGWFCFVPDAKDGKPHAMHGMLKQFKVS